MQRKLKSWLNLNERKANKLERKSANGERNNLFTYVGIDNIKKIHLIAFLILLLTGCATTYYGVSEEAWVAMSSTQKQTAIEGYNQRELLRTQRWIEQEKIRQSNRLEEEKPQFVNGNRLNRNTANRGELIQVTLLSGEIKIGRKNRPIEPITTRLLHGEAREITVRTISNKYISYTAQLTIQYKDGLIIVAPQRSGRGGIRIPYEHSWLRGAKYKAVKGSGRYKMRKMNIVVTIVPRVRQPAIVIY